jgi:hypothetical protein
MRLYLPNRRVRPITHRSSMPQFSRLPTRQPRVQRTTPLARIGLRRITRRNRTVRSPLVRRQPNRITSLSRAGTSLFSGRKLLLRACVRNPSTLLLKRGPWCKNNSTRGPRCRSRKRRSNRSNSRSGTRSHRSNGIGFVLVQTRIEYPGHPDFSEGALFLPSGNAAPRSVRQQMSAESSPLCANSTEALEKVAQEMRLEEKNSTSFRR